MGLIFSANLWLRNFQVPVHCACSLNCKSRIIQILPTIEWHLQRSVVGTCTCSLNVTFCVFFDQTFHIGHFDKLVFLWSKPWPYSMFCKMLNPILYGKVRGATRGQLQWRIVPCNGQSCFAEKMGFHRMNVSVLVLWIYEFLLILVFYYTVKPFYLKLVETKEKFRDIQ